MLGQEAGATGSQFKDHLQSLLLQKDRHRVLKHLHDDAHDQVSSSVNDDVEETTEPIQKHQDEPVRLSFLTELTSKAPSLLSVRIRAKQSSSICNQEKNAEDFKCKLSQLIGSRASSTTSSSSLLERTSVLSGPKCPQRSQLPIRLVRVENDKVAEDDMLAAIQASFASLSVVGNQVTLLSTSKKMPIQIDEELPVISNDVAEIVNVEEQSSTNEVEQHVQKGEGTDGDNLNHQREIDLEIYTTSEQCALIESSLSEDESKEEEDPIGLTEPLAPAAVTAEDEEAKSSKYWQAECIRLAKEIRDMEYFEANLILLLDRFPKSDVMQMLGVVSPQKSMAPKRIALLLEENPSRFNLFMMWSACYFVLLVLLFNLVFAAWVLEWNLVESYAGLFFSASNNSFAQ